MSQSEGPKATDMLYYIRSIGGRVYQPTGMEGAALAAQWFKKCGRSDNFCDYVRGKSSAWRTQPGVLKSAGYLQQDDGWWFITEKEWVGIPKPVQSLKALLELLPPNYDPKGILVEFLMRRAKELSKTPDASLEKLLEQNPDATYGAGHRTMFCHGLDAALLSGFTGGDGLFLPAEVNYSMDRIGEGGRPEGIDIVPIRVVPAPGERMKGVTKFRVVILQPEWYDVDFTQHYHNREFNAIDLGLDLNFLRMLSFEARNLLARFTSQLPALAMKKHEAEFAKKQAKISLDKVPLP